MRATLFKAVAILTLVLAVSTAVALLVGSQKIDYASLLSDPFSRTLFFRLRLPRVLMGLTIGASLAVTGASLQALFRNPLADPYTLGISGSRAIGSQRGHSAGVERAVAGVPFVFLASFLGAMLATTVVRTIARTGAVVLPGAFAPVRRSGESGIARSRVGHHSIRGRPEQLARNSALDDRQSGCDWDRARGIYAGTAGAGVGRALALSQTIEPVGDRRRHRGDARRKRPAVRDGLHTLCSLVVGVTGGDGRGDRFRQPD